MKKNTRSLFAEMTIYAIVCLVIAGCVWFVMVPGCAAQSAGIDTEITGKGNTVAPTTSQLSGIVNIAYVAAAGAGGTLLGTICWQLYSIAMSWMTLRYDRENDKALVEAAKGKEAGNGESPEHRRNK